MSDSDDLFDNIIEYDADDSSEKENEENLNLIVIKQPRTTKDQFSKIESFMNEHDESQIDTVTYNSLWENLAANLNDVGPPDHTTTEWRRIWSVHKHNLKRKRLVESTDSDNEAPGSISHLDQPSLSESVAVGNGNSKIAENIGIIESQSQFLKKVDVIIGNQTTMIANQELIIEELRSLNKKQKISKRS